MKSLVSGIRLMEGSPFSILSEIHLWDTDRSRRADFPNGGDGFLFHMMLSWMPPSIGNMFPSSARYAESPALFLSRKGYTIWHLYPVGTSSVIPLRYPGLDLTIHHSTMR